ncbi:MAG: hypothetical protein ACOC22_00015 [bacterium]
MGFIEHSENETIKEIVQEEIEKINEETPVEQEDVEIEKGE